MSASAIIPTIHTSAEAFHTSGAAGWFRLWLFGTRGDLPFARCREIADLAGQAMDLLGEAAPYVVAEKPAAAEAFLDQVDLTLMGVPSESRDELKRAVRGLHAWHEEFDGATTRTFMDRLPTDDGMRLPSTPDADPGPPRARTCPAKAVAGAPRPDSPSRDSSAQSEATDIERADLPIGFRLLETAVEREQARRELAGEDASVPAASRAVLAAYRPDSRRRLAFAAADACGVSKRAFERDGAISTIACTLFLVRLVRRRRGERRPAVA
jgi:hypothetical protein